LLEKLKSRKLAAFLITVLIHLVNGYLGNPIDEETMGEVTTLALAYIVGQGLADLGKEGQIISRFGTQVGQAAIEAVKAKKESSDIEGG
jgi:hypothetical protein